MFEFCLSCSILKTQKSSLYFKKPIFTTNRIRTEVTDNTGVDRHLKVAGKISKTKIFAGRSSRISRKLCLRPFLIFISNSSKSSVNVKIFFRVTHLTFHEPHQICNKNLLSGRSLPTP